MIAGVMPIMNFPKAPEMVNDLSKYIDVLILRYDQNNGDENILSDCWSTYPESDKLDRDVRKWNKWNTLDNPSKTIRDTQKWNRWNWRELMIRALDEIKPDYVLALDEDEKYGPGFEEDFKNFQDSGLPFMLFDYEMVTEDNRPVKKYPGARHCKAFKWMEGITYTPHYKGYAMPHFPSYIIPVPDYYNNRFIAKSKIQHYCFYTKEMEESKLQHLHK